MTSSNDKVDQSGADEREKFQAWADSIYSDRHESIEFDLREDGNYKHGLLRDLWKAWNAALQAQTAQAVGDQTSMALANLYHSILDVIPEGAHQRLANNKRFSSGDSYAQRGVFAEVKYRCDDMEQVYCALDDARTLLDATPQQAVAASSEPVAKESGDLLDWDRISEAAKQACNEYGQWMPERWLQLFVNAYNRNKS